MSIDLLKRIIITDVSDPSFTQVVEVEGVAIGYVGGGGSGGGSVDGQLVCQLVAEADALTIPDNLSEFVRSLFTGDEFVSIAPPQTPCDPYGADSF